MTENAVKRKNGRWKQQEVVTFGHPIGWVVRTTDSAEIETNQAKIHYSKTGTHIVPFQERDENGWRKSEYVSV